jgi:RHS repeat-associated protein
VNYTYDGDGQRVQKSNGRIYWYGLGGNVLDETDLTGSTTNTSFNEYVFFDGKRIARLDSSNNVLYYFADHLGTSRVNAQVPAGQTTATLCYDADFYPFGGERPPYTNTCSQNYKFTGKERDPESNLDNFSARYDSSSLGRFMSPDPTSDGIAIADPQSWNLYSYVRNRPLVSVDVGGNWATYIHADITTVALEGYVSAGDLKIMVNQQYEMDKDQAPEDSYKHAMRNGTSGQRAEDATDMTMDFINYNLAGAAKELNPDGTLSNSSAVMLGDAIHTLQDTTSPMHETPSGDPIPWRGGTLEGIAHFMGENRPSRSWMGIGRAIRLTMAAYMHTDPEEASKHGLNKWTFDNEANSRISHYVDVVDSLSRSMTPGQVAADRLCALGNPAACM